MKHFIERFAESAQNNWHKPAVCDYHGETFYYADVATHIAKLHIVFEKLGVKPGDKVKKGSKLMIYEAMKMKNVIVSPFDAVVESVEVKAGDKLPKGALLVKLS